MQGLRVRFVFWQPFVGVSDSFLLSEIEDENFDSAEWQIRGGRIVLFLLNRVLDYILQVIFLSKKPTFTAHQRTEGGQYCA